MTEDSPASAVPAPGLGTAHERLIARIFQHPLSHNLSWREVLALFHSIGSVEQVPGGAMELHLNGQHQTFKPAHDKDLGPEDVISLRHLLTRAGLAEGTPAPAATPPTDLVVVIDHADARIYAANPDDGASPQELHHFQHSSDRARRDADPDETWPDDTRFFAEIAQALEVDGRIVVVGHGKGQSNATDHLMAYLAAHHAAVHARVAHEITSDLSHQTLRQLLAAARHALQPALLSAGKTAG
ncbi:hypothetical protein LHP98_18695 [Rhodobacter sp. Har01]|uniref:hypothetical protein n=1 Tax=Rhodobacter sp. Har01 TaxID=2883999 RepID=UPI001D0803B5|nr:hypothetical protein [Rhodobacter sp. Har01]MCB6180149.1 hypothetical protein [Rhodobacter sp. Har01]